MNETILIGLLILSTVVAVASCCYIFHKKSLLENSLRQISQDLRHILDENTDEKIMIFTSNKTLIELLTQINRMIETMQRTRADYRKSEFSSKRMISNISHDIKTPLTVILGYLEIMRLKAEPDFKALAKVENKANQVLDMINKFFTLAKLEAGDMEVSISRININEACKRNVLDFYELLSNDDFTVELNIPDESIYAFGNDGALDRILFNLISNAVRYGAEGKYLSMALYEDAKFVKIEVIDKGKGIDKDAVPHVFNRLYTLDDSRNKEIQGNGLGLTIAKNLTEIMGGEISLQSEPYVKTVFTIKLKRITY